jgi:threonine dehydrogenase-like Zn-dependent dehydrogenase
MKAMTYRGPYKVRNEERDIPATERPNDAIVRVKLAVQNVKPGDRVLMAPP